MTIETTAQAGPSPSGGGHAPFGWKPVQGAPLTVRQVETLRRIAAGQSWQQIGRDLGITVHGVGSINKQILKKLGAVTAAHAVLLACQAGVLDGRPRSGPERHGDPAGFRRHQRRGEEPCPQCREGRQAYQREWNRARKSASVNSA